MRVATEDGLVDSRDKGSRREPDRDSRGWVLRPALGRLTDRDKGGSGLSDTLTCPLLSDSEPTYTPTCFP